MPIYVLLSVYVYALPFMSILAIVLKLITAKFLFRLCMDIKTSIILRVGKELIVAH